VKTRFVWDQAKNESNRRKHRVSFETAVRAFADPHAVLEQDRTVDGEERWQMIGLVDGNLMLLVAHTYSESRDDMTIRIISARRAKPHEEQRYDDENG
jgi:uncharacterized DUF497 family protein